MQSSLRGWRAVCAAVVALAIAGVGSVSAQDMASFEKNLTVHKLDNGLTFLIFERPVAPVFSFSTHVDVGAVAGGPGITGLAHMFEHMAFKGTPRDRHYRLREGKGRARKKTRRPIRPSSPRAQAVSPIRPRSKTAAQGFQGEGRGRERVHQDERVRRAARRAKAASA